MISDSDSDSEQAPPNDPREGTGGDVADERSGFRAAKSSRRGRGRLAADAAADRGGDGLSRLPRERRRVFHGGSATSA